MSDISPPDGHWHRRGTPETAKTPGWVGWTRSGCIEKGCDWAVYTSPGGRVHHGYVQGKERRGYLPTPTRAGNITHPDQLNGPLGTITAPRKVPRKVEDDGL